MPRSGRVITYNGSSALQHNNDFLYTWKKSFPKILSLITVTVHITIESSSKTWVRKHHFLKRILHARERQIFELMEVRAIY